MDGKDLAPIDRELDQLAAGISPQQLASVVRRSQRGSDLGEVDRTLARLAEGLRLPPPPPPPPRRPPPSVVTGVQPRVERTVELTTGDLQKLQEPEPTAGHPEQLKPDVDVDDEPNLDEQTDQVTRRALEEHVQQTDREEDSFERSLDQVLSTPPPNSEELPTVELALGESESSDFDLGLEADDLFGELDGTEGPPTGQVPSLLDNSSSGDQSALSDLASVLEDEDDDPTEAPAGRLFSERDIEAIRRASSAPPPNDEDPLQLSDSADLDKELDDLVLDDLDSELDLEIDEEPVETAEEGDDDGKKKGFFKKLFG